MCGIVGVFRQHGRGVPPDPAARRRKLAEAESLLEPIGDPTVTSLEPAARTLREADRDPREGGGGSAGLHVLAPGHGLALDHPTTAGVVAQRNADPLCMAGSVPTPGGALAFVYKTAAEIGELGDNTARLRAQIRDDELLHHAL